MLIDKSIIKDYIKIYNFTVINNLLFIILLKKIYIN